MALRAFAELTEHGFIRLTNHESWMERKAREWELSIAEGRKQFGLESDTVVYLDAFR